VQSKAESASKSCRWPPGRSLMVCSINSTRMRSFAIRKSMWKPYSLKKRR
jgi:hypothetical protein